jgi:bifunctional non-homologous end joining protein LigD
VNGSFSEYIEGIRERHTKRGELKIPMKAEILERWNSRILPRKLHERGAVGAEVYLRDYGRGISAAKCEALALYAEGEGVGEFAIGFWKRGFELTSGAPPSAEEWSALVGKQKRGDGNARISAEPVSDPHGNKTNQPTFFSLPAHLIPGKIVTMQPVDAPRDIEYYLHDPAFLAQPKRDGERLVIAAEAGGSMLGQKRSGRIVPVSPAWLPPIESLAKKYGAFVLDGERYFQDAFRKEHRSGAQAATANIKGGQPDAVVIERYAVFKALFVGDRDLTGQMEIHRVEIGNVIAKELEEMNPLVFEALPTSSTLPAKTALLEQQKVEEREGIVLVRWDCKYTGGKSNGMDAPFVRYKFLRTFDVLVTDLTETNADGRAFGAIAVAAFCEGKLTPLGSVGTGFTQEQARQLMERHRASPGGVVIEIATQGFTEQGQIWQARYLDLRPDKAPKDCKVVL